MFWPQHRTVPVAAGTAPDDVPAQIELALEGRRRVKEQLKKLGSFEYYHTSFSYTLQETGEERFVGVPEQAEPGKASNPVPLIYRWGLPILSGIAIVASHSACTWMFSRASGSATSGRPASSSSASAP